MKRAVLAVGWLALLAMPAAAQPDEGGGGGDDDLPPMMKNPRQMSGQARPEQNDPARQLTVRLVQGPMRRREEFGDVVTDFPPGALVHLVGVDARGKATLQSKKVDKGGRAIFDKLAADGSVSYYALALLPREGAVDRVESPAVMMPPEVGMRMILAGHGVKSGKPPADDVVGDDGGDEVPAPGEVTVELNGKTDGVEEVELLQVGVDKPVARTKVTPSTLKVRPAGRVRNPVADAALVDGTVDVHVQRRGDGIEGIEVALIEAEGGTPLKEARTDGEGRAVLAQVAGDKKLKVRALVHGRTLESPPFDPPAKGGVRIGISVDWQEIESLRARFSGIAAGADKVYIARAVGPARPTLSPPFQMTEARGAATQMIVFPGVLLSLHGGTQLDDDKLWFEMQFTVLNPAATPYDPGPDGLRIPLPKGYVGASVQDEMATRVKVDEDRGLVWRGSIPPGTRNFVASFALPTDDGKVDFDMDLPHGAVQSQLVLEDMPGVRIDAPAGVQRETRTQQGRKFVLLGGIERRPGEQLSFEIAGLPQAPSWRKWVRRGAGLAVLGLLGWAVFAITRGRRGISRREELEAEREELLQALTQLEADLQRKKIAAPLYKKQKAQLAGKLEAIYAELGTRREEQASEISEAP
ncbi:MAG TPA: hypothetical protein VFU21_03080 [Kofleriaceae bacterium]|nr:hypothetical protein [Kofleriaceae bacterium]